MRSHLRQTLATFVEVEVPFGVLCLRLEGLQHFRASLEAEAASSLLGVVARSLESTLWTTDHIGRWSDEQFLVILNGCRAETLHSVSERVRRMLARDGIEWWGERRSLPVSIGEAAAQSEDTVDSLIERAQKSLEAAAAWRGHSASAASGRTESMFATIGIIVVFGCVAAGYLMEHGNLRVLVQPAELIIIGGAATSAHGWSPILCTF